MKTLTRRLQNLEDLAWQQYLRSLTNEELYNLIETIDRDLLAQGWT